MAKHDPVTAELFDARTPGSLNYAIELREVMRDAVETSQLTRYEIAAEMSRLLGCEITKSQLDAWLAESKSAWRFPFECAAAFEAATASHCLQELLARKRGTKVVRGKDSLAAELGRVEHMLGELKQLREDIKKRLKHQ